MSRSLVFISLGILGVTALGFYLFFTPTSITCKDLKPMNLHIQTPDDVKALFPTSVQEIEVRTRCSIDAAQKAVDEIIALQPHERTFENTAGALDKVMAFSDISVGGNAIAVLEYVHPDEPVRNAAHEAVVKMNDFSVDVLSNNRTLYNAFKHYVEGNARTEQLSSEQRYFIQEMMEGFKRAGLDLPDEQLEQVKKLNKEIANLGLQFEKNIATDNRTISVTKDELAGLDDDFINNLMPDVGGKLLLGVDYPTYSKVLENCSHAATRERLFDAYSNRGYPANDAVLKDIIAKRDQLAHLLGFASYAHLDIDPEMAKTPERVQKFLQELNAKARVKADTEYARLKAELPADVYLNDNGTFNRWDTSYVKNLFKKKHLQIDEQLISEYFPMESTVKGLLAIYEQFFTLRFEQVPFSGLWHDDVQLIAVYERNTNALIGYLLLDLYPRPNKYNHACHVGILHAIKPTDNLFYPAVSLVIANFPKSTATKPSLLKRIDVSTFFHEFGHALHSLLGRTSLASQSGTQVKLDFVEMPSQMLEEWLQDKEILKNLTHHYQTSEALPDDMIQRIVDLRHFDSGDFVQRQLYLANLALAIYLPGEHKDPYTIQQRLFTSMRPHEQLFANDHHFASFGHLPSYAARYYGYLWSKVFALDMFEYIKQRGLLNPETGRRYVDLVLGKGGSKDPNELIKDFLGREPNDKAFIASLGL